MSIHYRKTGRGQPLVLFHGWGFDSLVWDPLLPALSSEFEVYAFDLPGFGLNPAMEWTDFKTQVLHHLPPRFSILGWSLGGLYASRLALEAQDRVNHLINVASSPYFISDEQWPGIAPSVFELFYKNILSAPQRVLQDFIKLQSRGVQLNETITSSPSKEGLELGLSVLGNWDLRQPLKTFNKPVSYIFGRLDAITPVKTLDYMEEHYPQFNYHLIKKSAHMPFISHPDEFLQILRETLL